ncbi:MAG TPA: porin [Verrucomicrobiae bacterium]|nr:porin [Verrucomicrobiae bacterium]
MKSQIGLVAVGLGALLAFPAGAQEADLKTKVEELEQELRIVKRRLELDKEVATEKSKTAPVLSAGANGFSLRSADTNFVMKIRGYVQADARFFPDDAAAAAANDSFLLRRVRPIIEGTVWDKFDYRVMLDFGSNLSLSSANDPFVQDAYVNARFLPEFQVQAGKFKEPVSLERLQSGANLLFVERAYTAQMAPNRDVGFQIQGDLFDAKLNYSIGAFNGVANGGSGDYETFDDEKDIVARVFATPFKDSNVDAIRGLGFGVAGTFGNQEGSLRGFVSAGQQTMFSYNPANVGTNQVTVVADGEHWRIAPQTYYYYGPFGIFGEYIISNQKVRKNNPTEFATFRNAAWSVSASYFLTGEDNSFKAVTPKRPFKPSEGGWGAFELAARVQHIDIDDRVFPLYANPNTSTSGALTWGVGLNWHLNKNFKVNLNYEKTDFDGGTSALLAHGEDVIMTRAQISF